MPQTDARHGIAATATDDFIYSGRLLNCAYGILVHRITFQCVPCAVCQLLLLGLWLQYILICRDQMLCVAIMAVWHRDCERLIVCGDRWRFRNTPGGSKIDLGFSIRQVQIVCIRVLCL